jgi:catechol 2,3-dioxygenase-like lactoylglutathione lyase family enzyme
MTTKPTATRIIQVATVYVPVTDQDAALRFYLDELGFERRGDFLYGGTHRWIEVAPPGSTISLALVPPTEGSATDHDTTRCALITNDIDADHATLSARGVDVDPVIGRNGTQRPGLVSPEITVDDPTPPQFNFRDPDGNRFLIVQRQ